MNFVSNTLPKPVLFALVYRLIVLHFASRILPNIGADSWEDEGGVDNGWEGRPVRLSRHPRRKEAHYSDQTSKLTYLLLTYRQSIFVTVYSHLLSEFRVHLPSPASDTRLWPVLDHSSQVWWRWMNIFFTLIIWSIELFVSNDDDIVTTKWKVD